MRRTAVFPLVFDVLSLDAESVATRPYGERRQILEELRLDALQWRTPETFDDGQALWEAVCEHELEGEPKNQRERLLRPWPQFTDEVLATGADEAAEDEGDDDRVVELTGNRDEVRNDVEGQCQVADESKEQQLASMGHARVTGKPADEDDAVGNERCECAGVAMPTQENESEHERGVDDSPHCGSGEDPGPPRHEAEGYANDIVSRWLSRC